MIAFTTPITVTKIDYFGNPYQAIVYPRKQINYAQLWERHKELLEQEVEVQMGSTATGFNSRAYNSYEENKLWEEER